MSGPALLPNDISRVDVLWTMAPVPFGGTSGNSGGRVNSRIDGHLDAYRKFSERNTGTIVAVRRKSKAVQQWLSLTLDVYIQHQSAKLNKGTAGMLINQPFEKHILFIGISSRSV